MIEKLTKEQESLMLQTRDEWIDLFFNKVKEQKGIDKEKFEKGISWLYTDLLGKPMPKIVYCDSWESCLTDIDLLRSQGKKSASVRDSVWDSVRDSVSTSVRSSLRDSVRSSLRSSVSTSLSTSVWYSVWYSVWDSVRDSVSTLGFASFREYSLYIDVTNYAWVAYLDFFEKIGVLKDDNFRAYKELIRSGVFVTYPYEDIVFAVQPPIAIERDDQGKLHSTEKEAVLFKDGTKYFFIHGVPFSEEKFKIQSKSTK